MGRSSSHSPEPRSPDGNILYFGYGPIVSEIVRKRRNIRVTNIEAAYLEDYSLSFDIGGVANIVRKRGYQVHGLLMTLASLQDWKRIQSFDIRRRVATRDITHYPKSGCLYSEEFDLEAFSLEEEKEEGGVTTLAYTIEFPEDVEAALFDGGGPQMERLPQEGYLKLIADGMHKHRVDINYIQDEILNVPYIPDRSLEEYFKFPKARKVRKITFPTYKHLCDRAKFEGKVFFVLGDSVFRLGKHDPNNPLAAWLEEHGHGKGDCTFFVQLTLMDPCIPFCDSKANITPPLIEWAENQLVGYIQQHGLSATNVFQFAKDGEQEDNASLSTSLSSSGLTSSVELKNPRRNRISHFWKKRFRRIRR